MRIAAGIGQRNAGCNEFTGTAAGGQSRALSLGVLQRVPRAAFFAANPAGFVASAHTALRAAAGGRVAIGTLR